VKVVLVIEESDRLLKEVEFEALVDNLTHSTPDETKLAIFIDAKMSREIVRKLRTPTLLKEES